jgi:hypothetical protein
MKTQFKSSVTSSLGLKKRHITVATHRNETQTASRLVRILSLFVLTFLVAASSYSQEKETEPRKIDAQEMQQRSEKGRTLKGIVVENGESLPGVTVQLKGTRKGTETNENGIFQFPIPLMNGDVLVFSFLGMETKEVTITSKTTYLRVTMKEDSEVLELIVLDAPQTSQLYKSKKSAFKKKKKS